MSKWAHLMVLTSSSPFPATMRKWPHLLVCRGRCGIMDPAGVGWVRRRRRRVGEQHSLLKRADAEGVWGRSPKMNAA